MVSVSNLLSTKPATNNRLTSAWTKSTEEAYGSTGKTGRNGEKWLAEFLKANKYEVIDHEDTYKSQVQGIDLTISRSDINRPYTVDVKSNIKDDGTFFVETSVDGWLLSPNKISDCIWHVNPATGTMAWYSRSKMRRVLNENISSSSFQQLIRRGNLLMLNVNNLPSQMSFIRVFNKNKSTKTTSCHKYKHEAY